MKNWTRNWCSSLTNSHHTLLEYLGSSKCLPRPSTSNRPKSWPLLILCNKSYRAVESSETAPAESAEWSDHFGSGSCSKSTSLAVCDFTSSSSTPQDSATEPAVRWWVMSSGVRWCRRRHWALHAAFVAPRWAAQTLVPWTESRTKVLPRSDQHHDARKMLGRCEIVLLKPVNRKRNKLCEDTLMLFHTMGLSSDISTRKASRHSSVFDILSCLRCF